LRCGRAGQVLLETCSRMRWPDNRAAPRLTQLIDEPLRKSLLKVS
jgi:hypothetical protein